MQTKNDKLSCFSTYYLQSLTTLVPPAARFFSGTLTVFFLIVLRFKCKVMGWQNPVNQTVFHDHLRFFAGLGVGIHLRL